MQHPNDGTSSADARAAINSPATPAGCVSSATGGRAGCHGARRPLFSIGGRRRLTPSTSAISPERHPENPSQHKRPLAGLASAAPGTTMAAIRASSPATTALSGSFVEPRQ